MSALGEYRKFAAGVPRRNIFGVEDVERGVSLADAAIAELEAEVKATASMCDEVRAELNKVCVELEQAQAERDAARRVIVAAIAQMSKETRACAEEGSGDE